MMISSMIIFIMTLLALFPPFLAPNDPNLIDITHKLQGSSSKFPLGTDHLGRCILSRLIYGTRTSLGTAFLVMGLTMMISIPLGIYAGFRGGWVDYLFMRMCDILMAFPSLLLSLALIGILGPGLGNLILAMVLVHWVFYARVIRGMVLSVKEQNFILAAKVCGTPRLVIVIKHILPAIISQVVVLVFMDIGGVVLAISSFSFLGFGIQPPGAEWGMMINDSKPFFRNAPSLMLYPGMMILIVVVAFNLFGEALRDALDLRRE
ncbi:nickel ABC transporter permease subunit NikC [Domibacillus aminovorans]|uniref:Nickel ABC transporter permease subunit NikC n=2 Tax=Domibacillus aminovorans TaxID=29332 RepID=A0A177L5C1_9BACI|nr:nickel ABC transporter permease subunit NikC [Domibacillus aminovorans]